MPYYSGQRAEVVFNAQFMSADSWEAELSVESVSLTTINILRDQNINGNIAAVRPSWADNGVPVRKISGGMREVSGKMHGFWSNQVDVPSVGDTISVALKLDGLNFWIFDQCLVTKMNVSVEIKGSIEWDMEWESIGDGDFTGRT